MLASLWDSPSGEIHGRKLTREASRLGSTIARLKLKGIYGDLHNQWSMWFNSRRTEEPYPGLTCYRLGFQKRRLIRKDDSTGVAWLSSARAVGCSLQWGNERNPCRMLNLSYETTQFIWEEVGTTSSQHGPYIWGDTHATMKPTKGCQVVTRS